MSIFNDGPKFSILINNYNYEKYVGKAIESALNQTYKNIEVIVVDDGSTDDSRKVISCFSSKIIFIEKENAGQGSAFNAGFPAVTGDIVIVLDSDDYLFPDACDEIAKKWKKNTVMCCYYLAICDPDGNVGSEKLPDTPLLENGHREYVLNYGYIPVAPMSGVAYSREYLANIFPLDESIWINGFDHLFSFVAPVFGQVVLVNQSLGAYRMGHASKSQHDGISLRKFRKNLQTADFYAKAIESAAFKKLGLVRQYKYLLGPYFWKNRLVSMCIKDGGHQFSEDRKASVFIYGVRAFLLWPEISFFKRLKNVLQLALMVSVPSEWVVRYVAKKKYINFSAM